MRPLPPGEYTLEIGAKSDTLKIDGKIVEVRPAMTAKPLRVRIVKDPGALTIAEIKLQSREAADPFARHVAEVYSIDPVVRTWLAKLLDDDPRVGLDACGELQGVIRLPSGGDEYLREAAIKFSHPGTGQAERNLLREISLISRGIGTENSVDAIVTIATQAADEDYVRKMAVSDLAGVPGAQATDALEKLAADENSPVYWEALGGLANRHNTSALKPLIRAAKDAQSKHRCFAILALTEFRDLSEVREMLNADLTDPDAKVRASAKNALEWKEFDPETQIRWGW